jgi:hypothetical protein
MSRILLEEININQVMILLEKFYTSEDVLIKKVFMATSRFFIVLKKIEFYLPDSKQY